MDWVSRRRAGLRLSNTLGAELYVEALEEALGAATAPRDLHTDRECPSRKRGQQFTTTVHRTPEAPRDHISMTGKSLPSRKRGVAADNIFVERLWRSRKYEEVSLNAMRESLKAKPAWACSASTKRSASTRAWAIARRPAYEAECPADMWTIGKADRIRLPHFRARSEAGRLVLRPHTHRHNPQQQD